MRLFPIGVLAALAAAPLLAQSERPEEQVNPLAGNREAIAAGQSLYTRSCAVCHGPSAQGDRGPSLVSGRFPHGGSDGEIFLSIRAGIKGSQMPPFPQFTNQQIWQLIAFLRDLSGVKAPQTASATETTPGDPAAGKSIFEGKAACLSCHIVNGAGKAVGPDLSDAAKLPAAQLRAKIVDPNQAPAPAAGRGGRGGRGGFGGPATVIVTTRDGREHRGLRKSADSFDVSLVDTDGVYRSFERSAVQSVRIESASLMPAGYAKRLSGDELQNVVAYLKTLSGGDASKTAGPSILSWDRLRNSDREPHNYLTYWGDLGGKHYSALTQINAANVKNLQTRWALPLPGNGGTQAMPLVIDGIMYTVGPAAGALEVMALDARTGRVLWRYQRRQKETNPNEINRENRGVSVIGNRVFFGTLDAYLVALDARTGRLLWEKKVADTMQGYSITSPPLPIKDMVVTGISGGEFGIAGFLEAYDQATGKKLWRFNTVPQPGERGHETWDGDSWKRGSAATWLPGSYDPDLNLLYWAVGNPGPGFNGDVRKGDNLYSCSVIALDPDTGKLKWHYQFTPNDTHDWDSTEDLVLVDRVWHGTPRKLMLHADRNGVFYVLDRTDGKFLGAYPFVRATWVKGWDEVGRPITTENWRADETGRRVYPAVGGGTNFQAPSYSPLTGWMYFLYHDGGGDYTAGPATYEAGAQYSGRGARRGRPATESNEAPPTDGIMAFDPETGKTQWKFELSEGALAPGLLSTAGGVVFSATPEGNFIALDARTGKVLWRFYTGARLTASPISYAIAGKQYVALTASGILYSFALPH